MRRPLSNVLADLPINLADQNAEWWTVCWVNITCRSNCRTFLLIQHSSFTDCSTECLIRYFDTNTTVPSFGDILDDPLSFIIANRIVQLISTQNSELIGTSKLSIYYYLPSWPHCLTVNYVWLHILCWSTVQSLVTMLGYWCAVIIPWSSMLNLINNIIISLLQA